MPRRRKRFSHTPGRRLRNPPLRKNATFLGFLIILAMFAVFYFFAPDGIFGEPPEGGFAVHFIDVGQGDSILIQSPCGESMLIDTGPRAAYYNLASYLDYFGVREFSYVIFTHPHADHIGSAYRIVREFDIGTLIMPQAAHDTETFRRLVEAVEYTGLGITRAVPGSRHRLGDAEFMIIAPLYEGYANLNDYSVVILMQYGRTRFLFTGDIERQSENEIIRYVEEHGLDISADVLDVAHHGSRTSSQQRFLELIRPSIAVIQVGAGNDFGHPTREVLDRLEYMGAQILRTDRNGDIMIRSDGRRLNIQVSRGDPS